MCVYLFCGSRLEDFRRHVKRAAQAFQLRPWELLQGGDLSCRVRRRCLALQPSCVRPEGSPALHGSSTLDGQAG